MQSKHLERNIPTSVTCSEVLQLNTFSENLRYSLQRRLEDLIALGQENLALLSESDSTHHRTIENNWVLLEDKLRLACHDWALYEWLENWSS